MNLLHSRTPQFIIAFGCLLGLPSAAFPASPFKQIAKSSTSSQQHTVVVGQLHAAHNLLIHADHNYQGNRAKAAHEVNKAIHALTGHHHHTSSNASKGNVKLFGANIGKSTVAKTSPKMPQAQSDAHLKQASQLLTGVLGKLPPGHKAAANVQNSIRHIQTALQIK